MVFQQGARTLLSDASAAEESPVKLTSFRVALIVGVLVAGAHLAYSVLFPSEIEGLLDIMEMKLLDARMRPARHGQDVAIVAADERSIDAYGRWPWNRKRLAKLVDALREYNVKVIGFDATFSDPDDEQSYSALRSIMSKMTDAGILSDGLLWKRFGSDLDLLHAQVRQNVRGPTAAPTSQKERCLRGAAAKSRSVADALACLDEDYGTAQRYARSFADTMSDEIRAISPDEEFARALRQANELTIMGHILLYGYDELAGLDKRKLQDGLDGIKSAALAGVFTEKSLPGGALLLEPAQVEIKNVIVRAAASSRTPLKLIAQACKHFGYFNIIPDPDGTLRRIDLVARVNNTLMPSLSLLAAALYLGGPLQPIADEYNPHVLKGFSLSPERFVPTDGSGRIMVNYFGDTVTVFPTFSAVDVIDKKVPPELLAGKVVLFGMTAIGLFDQRVTPFNQNAPGVGIHATAVQNMIDGNYLVRPIWAPLLEALLCVLLAILVGFTSSRLRAEFSGVIALILLSVTLFLDYKFIFPAGIWFRLVPFIAAVVLTYIAVTTYRYLTEVRAKQQLRLAFQYYMTPAVIDEVTRHPERLRLGGQRREMTVMFSDIRSFTTISETLTPEELVRLLNEYLTPMTDIVFRHAGTLDKYIGDAIMAFFGAPLPQEDHARRACYMALDMMTELDQLRAQWKKKKMPDIKIGIGVNSGPMSVGNMGSNTRFNYTVMGDNVNLASRLEGITKVYGVGIIISESTYEEAKADVHARELDAVRVKGKKLPVHIYELVGQGAPDEHTQTWIQEYHAGLAAYRAQHWDEAQAAFARVLEHKLDDPPARLMLDRVAKLRNEHLEPEWDGVYTLTSK
jgi:adenylate cyclase